MPRTSAAIYQSPVLGGGRGCLCLVVPIVLAVAARRYCVRSSMSERHSRQLRLWSSRFAQLPGNWEIITDAPELLFDS